MDKQQFDHIENRIRQASDEIFVPFNEEAWRKMDIKLDMEFNKDRRRGFIWWWFSFLLLGIAVLGIYLYNYNPFELSKKIGNNVSATYNTSFNKSKIGPTADGIKEPGNINSKEIYTHKTGKIVRQNNNVDEINVTKKTGTSDDGGIRNPVVKINPERTDVEKESISIYKLTKISNRNNKNKSIVSTVSKNENRKQVKTDIPYSPGNQTNITYRRKDKGTHVNIKSKDSDTRNNVSNTAKTDTEEAHATNTGSDKSYTDNTDKYNNKTTGPDKTYTTAGSDSSSSDISKNIKAEEPRIKTDSLKSLDSISKKSALVKLDRTSSKGLYFLASVAGDATGIKTVAIADTKLMYGIGIGYRFNNKISVQTGFYFGKKVYYADSDDYKVKPGSYVAKIISAEAECYIYEIPITLRYDVFHSKTSGLYLTSGLSSYILKRETYDIHFYNPMGSYRHMSYTYKHNVNYLSVFNLSLGYEHKVSSSLYIQAEPYIKLPLTGLGEGSVKLYSAGLQIGVKYQPLRNKK